jgi:recombination protein RecA
MLKNKEETQEEFTFPPRKMNAIGVKSVIDDIQKKHGPDSIFLLGKHGLRPLENMSTGIPLLDIVTGGGIPIGKMIMIHGSEGAGKSSFCMHMSAKYEAVAYIDAEHTLTEERAALFGNDKSKMIISQPEYAEEAFRNIVLLAEQGMPLIIVDSVPALTPKKQLDVLDETEKIAGVAMTANVLNYRLSGVNAICNRTGTTIIFVNQQRDKMNAMPFGEQISLPGGHAIKHYSWYILAIARKENITVTVGGDKVVVGALTNFKIGQKNRSASPFQNCDVPLFYDQGFSSIEDMKENAKLARFRYIAKMENRNEEETN